MSHEVWRATDGRPPQGAANSPGELPGPPRSPRPPRRASGWLYLFFFLLSTYTILASGAVSASARPDAFLVIWGLFAVVLDLSALWEGLPYAAWLIGILGCHEMGHYIACRYYRIAATPPLFLPGPVFPFGTLGAFIRIRAPFPNRVALFDVGVAGPLAGFAVTVPALLYGLSRSVVVPATGVAGWELGDSLLLTILADWVAPATPEGTTLLLHPVAYAGWVGLFATALNLLPVGQLDGGHLAYALSRRAHRVTSFATVVALVILGSVYLPWIFWGLVLLLVMGRRHPALLDESAPLPVSRRVLAFVCLLILVLCFIPIPFPDLVGGAVEGP